METPSLEILISSAIAFGLEVFPDVKAKWDKWNAKQKQLAIMAMVLVVSVVGLILDCQRGIQCPADWFDAIEQLVYSFVLSLIASQGAHSGVKYLSKSEKEES